VVLTALSVDNENMRSRSTSGQASQFDAIIATPAGQVGIVLNNGALADVSFLSESAELRSPRTAAAKEVCHQLQSYFTHPHSVFHVSLVLKGTPFQQRVWRALRRIPSGQTLTYGALASKLSTSARAVGNACRANPVPIVIPCHRVVAANGMGGFMGKRSGGALRLKQWLLAHERDR